MTRTTSRPLAPTRRGALGVLGAGVNADAADAINAVIAKLTQDDLVALNRRSVDEKASSKEIATSWLTEKGLV